MESETKQVLVAMSGGVDSAVSALLLQQQGKKIQGVTLHLYGTQEAGCGSLKEAEGAKQICQRLGVPHQLLDGQAVFQEQVIEKFVRAYEQGNTPNPCVNCNRFVKFGFLLEEAKQQGFDQLATGHYVRVVFDETTGRYLLKKAKDPKKDQSYVLYHLTQEQLAHLVFPLGELTKEEVRTLATEHGFENAKKPDSQDICFVPTGDYATFLREWTGKEYPSGEFVDLEGNKLGQHKGMIHYTIGQRKGLGLALGSPAYVCRKKMEENQVVVGPESALWTDYLEAGELNFISLPTIDKPTRVLAATRYQKPPAAATALVVDGRLQLRFDTPQRAITAGQSVVLYDPEDQETVIGGGVILER